MGNFRCPILCFIEVLAVEQKVSAQLLIRFSKRTSDGYRLAIPNAHRRRVGDWGKSIIGEIHPGSFHVRQEIKPALPCGSRFLRGIMVALKRGSVKQSHVLPYFTFPSN